MNFYVLVLMLNTFRKIEWNITSLYIVPTYISIKNGDIEFILADFCFCRSDFFRKYYESSKLKINYL